MTFEKMRKISLFVKQSTSALIFTWHKTARGSNVF